MQMTCCSTASLGSLLSQAPAPITLSHFSQAGPTSLPKGAPDQIMAALSSQFLLS